MKFSVGFFVVMQRVIIFVVEVSVKLFASAIIADKFRLTVDREKMSLFAAKAGRSFQHDGLLEGGEWRRGVMVHAKSIQLSKQVVTP